MFSFNELLQKNGLNPSEVLVMRHRPHETSLRRIMPWLINNNPSVFNHYQQLQQGKNTESALKSAKYLAAFLGMNAGTAHFVGLYERGDFSHISNDEFWSKEEIQILKKMGMQDGSIREGALFFDLKLTEMLSIWSGKLVIDWTGLERSWYRWADKNTFPIRAILEENAFQPPMPQWEELVLSWEELQNMPPHWEHALRQWRGIYYIFDTSDRLGYVGSAYGKDNILGRWQNYAATGHGGNKNLIGKNPSSFRFSILQRVSPDMESTEVIDIEGYWKKRLHTKDFGLNDN